MQSSQPCSSGDLSGEPSLSAPTASLSLPGFSPEQVNALTKLFLDILSDPEPPEPPYQMPTFVAVPGSHLKHKRNVRTRQQYKRRKAQAKAKALRVKIQEVDHSQEIEHSEVQISVENASKHVVLKRKAPWDCVATLLHAIIAFIGIMVKPIMIQHGAIGMRRMGVG